MQFRRSAIDGGRSTGRGGAGASAAAAFFSAGGRWPSRAAPGRRKSSQAALRQTTEADQNHPPAAPASKPSSPTSSWRGLQGVCETGPKQRFRVRRPLELRKLTALFPPPLYGGGPRALDLSAQPLKSLGAPRWGCWFGGARRGEFDTDLPEASAISSTTTRKLSVAAKSVSSGVETRIAISTEITERAPPPMFA